MMEKFNKGSYLIKALIGLIIMVGFMFLPAPEPITHAGMVVIGIFVGLIWLWATVDMIWPTFLALLVFSTVAYQVFPDSTALEGFNEGVTRSLGDWIPLSVLVVLLFVDVVSESGIVRRVAIWFITRPIAKKSAWGFTLMFIVAVYLIGLFFDVAPLQLMMFALAREVFEIAGITKEDKYSHVLFTAITFSAMIAFVATPFGHAITIVLVSVGSGMASGILGTAVAVNWAKYILVALPICTLVWVLMICFMRFIVKPDMSKLEAMDNDRIEALKPGKMTPKENFVAVMTVILILVWVLPGILDILMPEAAITGILDKFSLMVSTFTILVIFAIVPFEDGPVFKPAETMTRIPWMLFFMLIGISLICNTITVETTGISAFIIEKAGPALSTLSPYAFVTVLAIIGCLCTNFANNNVLGILLLSLGVPVGVGMGINPVVIIVAITLGCSLAFALPSAFVPIANCFSDPLGGPKHTLKYGVATMLISCVCLILVFPLATAVFG